MWCHCLSYLLSSPLTETDTARPWVLLPYCTRHGHPTALIRSADPVLSPSSLVHIYVYCSVCLLQRRCHVNEGFRITDFRPVCISRTLSWKKNSNFTTLLQTKVGICISTYSNADVVCYSVTWPTELNDIHLIVDGTNKQQQQRPFNGL